jgi:hypothetical protein
VIILVFVLGCCELSMGQQHRPVCSLRFDYVRGLPSRCLLLVYKWNLFLHYQNIDGNVCELSVKCSIIFCSNYTFLNSDVIRKVIKKFCAVFATHVHTTCLQELANKYRKLYTYIHWYEEQVCVRSARYYAIRFSQPTNRVRTLGCIWCKDLEATW